MIACGTFSGSTFAADAYAALQFQVPDRQPSYPQNLTDAITRRFPDPVRQSVPVPQMPAVDTATSQASVHGISDQCPKNEGLLR
jgi:hypothetical protein